MNDLEILKKRVLKLIDEYGSIKTRSVSEENFKDARLIGYKDVVHIIDTMLKSKFKPGDRIRDKSSSDQKIYTVTEFITDGIAVVDEYGERFTKYFDEDDWDVYELVTDPVKQQEDNRLKEAKDALPGEVVKLTNFRGEYSYLAVDAQLPEDTTLKSGDKVKVLIIKQ